MCKASLAALRLYGYFLWFLLCLYRRINMMMMMMMLHSNAPAGSRTYDLSITSPKPYHYTEPPTHSTLTLKQISVYNELRTCVWLWKQTQRLISIQNYNTAHNPTKITKICTKIAKFYTNKYSESVIKLYILSSLVGPLTDGSRWSLYARGSWKSFLGLHHVP